MADESGASAPVGWEPWAIGRLQALAATLLGAVASLTFVAFVGATVLWARAYALGLPTDMVVSVVPKSQLIATGASTLAGFAVLGLLAAGVLYIIDPSGVPSLQTRIGLAALVGVELAITLSYSDLTTTRLVGCVIVLALGLVVMVLIATLFEESALATPATSDTSPAPAEPSDDLSGLLDTVLDGVRKWGAATTPPVVPAPPSAPSTPPPLRVNYKGQLLVVAVIVVALVATQLISGQWWLTAAVATALGLYVIVLAIAWSSGRRFWATGLAAFASVAVFGAALSTLRYLETHQVQPIAALRTGEGAPVCGIFIGEAKDRLYLARLDRDRQVKGPTTDGATGHLFWLDRKAVTGWALGALQSQNDAEHALFRLNRRVIEERRTVTSGELVDEQKAGEAKATHTEKTTTKVVPPADRTAPACSIYAL